MALEITDSNWEELLKGDKPVVMDFGAEWCGPCRMIAEFYDSVAEEYEGRVIVGKVDIENSPNVTFHYGIKNIPTLLFFKKGGEFVEKYAAGGMSKSKLIEKIDKLL